MDEERCAAEQHTAVHSAKLLNNPSTLTGIVYLSPDMVTHRLAHTLTLTLGENKETKTQAGETVGRLSRLLGVYANLHNKETTA